MSVFAIGKKCSLYVRDHMQYQIEPYTEAIMRQDTTQFTLTGSYPMRHIDTREVWDKERAAGDILFSIYKGDDFIGICGLHNLRDIYHSAELRILIFDKDAVGKGIGTEACCLLVNYGFQKLNLHRIWLGCNAENVRAIKCYEKVGFKEEGRLREDIFCGGKYVDAVRMGILRHEWKGLDAA